MTDLSVIIPCYNCADTLAEAVASVYRQDVKMPFDVTLVDDGSTDATYEVMKRLAGEHTNIRLVRHASNLGGGSARNTAVSRSDGDLIFCLDADDMLGDGFLETITAFWLRRRCDAVGMGTLVTFRGSDIHDVAHVSQFEGQGRKVRFESFLDGPDCSLNVVFLMTRDAFRRVGGYPTEHGFDTQGMGFRFLGNGLAAYTCPNALYYHRTEYNESYYLREQREDRLNWNWFNLLDEFLYLFRPQIRRKILTSDLFRVPGRPVPQALSRIVYGQTGIYVPNYRQLIRLGRDGVARRFSSSRDAFEQYWLGTYCLAKGNNADALSHLRMALSAGFDYRIVYYRLLQSALQLSGRKASTAQALAELVEYSQPYPAWLLPWNERLFARLIANRHTRRPSMFLKYLLDRLRHRSLQ